MCIKACVLLQGQKVFWCWDVLPYRGIVQKVLGKRNGFGDEVIAQEPSHPCLVGHNTVCHVTPYVFLLSEPQMEQCCSHEWLLCLWCQCFHVQSKCLGKHLPQCFHESALKGHMVHCDSLATLAPVRWLCTERVPQCHSSGISNVLDQWAVETTMDVWLCQCGTVNHGAMHASISTIPQELCHSLQ